jgi:hypothetical protein
VRRIPLSVESVVRAARRRARWRGDVVVPEPLEILLASLDHEARLTPLGRRLARATVVDMLAKRLRLDAARRRSPELFETPVEAPVFIVGFPRTGTTLLQRLLAQAPGARSPKLWEVWSPVPPPRSQLAKRARRAGGRLGVEAVRYLAPALEGIHPLRADDVDEDRELQAAGFLSGHFGLMFDVPSYVEYVFRASHEQAVASYEPHRGFLQCLQSSGSSRWVLKSPAHRLFVRAVLAVYPDATVVETHRAPHASVASLCSLVATSRGVFSDEVDLCAVGADCLRAFEVTSARIATARMDEGARFHDVDFAELVDDPVQTVTGLAARLGLEVTADYRAALERWVASDRGRERPRHTYELAQFGLSSDDVDAAVARISAAARV